ncbi:MAG: glycosyltransferase family 39 protein, partial [Spirochaetia bacterium]|nr:glycosyltransferase family 39 protein [Spirochaetia bacterium]
MPSITEFTRRERTGLAFLLLGIVLTLTLTLGFDAMDIDSSQYAEIAREMVASKEFIFLRDNGRKYLDKPVLTFWSIAASYLIFGVNNVAFRIPALLISLLAARSLYRIAVLTSGSRRRGWLAAIIYLGCPGLFAMVLDPKIDVYLTAYLVFIHHAY